MNLNKLFGFFLNSPEEEAEIEVLNTITEGAAEEQGEPQTVTCLDETQLESVTAVASEEQKAHTAELMKQIYRQFLAVGHKFYFKDQPDKVAFELKGQRVVSKFRDERIAKAMVVLSEAKGWKTIKISGDREFCRAVWLEASIRGIKSRGYQPTEQDLSELESVFEKHTKNHIEQVSNESPAFQDAASGVIKQRTDSALYAHSCENGHNSDIYSGKIVGHGVAPYKHDPKNKDSYFVKLLTDQGEKVIWGVDLKRAISKNNVQKGDRVTLEFKGNKDVIVEQNKYNQQGKFLGTEMIATHRNEWEFQKIGSLEKVAQTLSPEISDIGSPKSSTSISKQSLDANSPSGSKATIRRHLEDQANTRTGHLLDHGQAPYQHDSKNEASYFVKLATDHGEKVIWGVDLERAINDSSAQKGDRVTLEFKGNKAVTVEQSKYDKQGKFLGKETIQTHKNEWKIQKSEQHKVVEAVADKLIDGKIKDVEKRGILKAAVDARFCQLAESGKMPTIHMYDKSAPFRGAQRTPEQPTVERNTERTR